MLGSVLAELFLLMGIMSGVKTGAAAEGGAGSCPRRGEAEQAAAA